MDQTQFSTLIANSCGGLTQIVNVLKRFMYLIGEYKRAVKDGKGSDRKEHQSNIAQLKLLKSLQEQLPFVPEGFAEELELNTQLLHQSQVVLLAIFRALSTKPKDLPEPEPEPELKGILPPVTAEDLPVAVVEVDEGMKVEENQKPARTMVGMPPVASVTDQSGKQVVLPVAEAELVENVRAEPLRPRTSGLGETIEVRAELEPEPEPEPELEPELEPEPEPEPEPVPVSKTESDVWEWLASFDSHEWISSLPRRIRTALIMFLLDRERIWIINSILEELAKQKANPFIQIPEKLKNFKKVEESTLRALRSQMMLDIMKERKFPNEQERLFDSTGGMERGYPTLKLTERGVEVCEDLIKRKRSELE